MGHSQEEPGQAAQEHPEAGQRTGAGHQLQTPLPLAPSGPNLAQAPLPAGWDPEGTSRPLQDFCSLTKDGRLTEKHRDCNGHGGRAQQRGIRELLCAR